MQPEDVRLSLSFPTLFQSAEAGYSLSDERIRAVALPVLETEDLSSSESSSFRANISPSRSETESRIESAAFPLISDIKYLILKQLNPLSLIHYIDSGQELRVKENESFISKDMTAVQGKQALIDKLVESGGSFGALGLNTEEEALQLLLFLLPAFNDSKKELFDDIFKSLTHENQNTLLVKLNAYKNLLPHAASSLQGQIELENQRKAIHTLMGPSFSLDAMAHLFGGPAAFQALPLLENGVEKTPTGALRLISDTPLPAPLMRGKLEGQVFVTLGLKTPLLLYQHKPPGDWSCGAGSRPSTLPQIIFKDGAFIPEAKSAVNALIKPFIAL